MFSGPFSTLTSGAFRRYNIDLVGATAIIVWGKGIKNGPFLGFLYLYFLDFCYPRPPSFHVMEYLMMEGSPGITGY